MNEINRKIPSCLIEAAHFRAAETPTEEVFQSALIAVGLLGELKKAGYTTQTMMLVDDIVRFEEKPDNSVGKQNLQAGLSLAKDAGFFPQHLVMESFLIKPSMQMLAELRKVGKTVYHENTERIMLKAGWVPLASEIESGEIKPSGALLDATLYLSKITKFANETITILPSRFQRQQHRAQQVLAESGIVKPAVTVAYFQEDGEVSLIEHWD